MATLDVDDEADVEETFDIIRPTVLQQIREILEQYRNDVQIIKELIQNADDAGATEMKILYEGNTINEEIPNEKHFRKFLRAPAFVFYNNAVFNDDDWKGVRSIYTSEKARDALKVGRFGLGFKSIFHLTDCPCIVSGDKVMFIDPQLQDENKICTVIKLKNLKKSKRVHIDEFLNAFCGTFDFNQQDVERGIYSHTIFWFPLRKGVSLLSDIIYSEIEVKTLLDSFLEKPEWNMIFTKTLSQIDVFVDINAEEIVYHRSQGSKEVDQISLELRQMSQGKEIPCFSVICETDDGESICEKKLDISKSLGEIGRNVPSTSLHWSLEMQIKSISVDPIGGETTTISRWLIIHFLKGGQLSKNTQMLLKDTNLCYHHLVGCAVQLYIAADSNFNDADGDGHLFCFQPLPKESHYSTTGLPVHLNAYFALGNNRREVKWEDSNNTFLLHTDHAIAWNHALLGEIFPYAYRQLILEAVDQCVKKDNLDFKMVYNIFPEYEKVAQRWKPLVESFYDITKDENIVYTINGGGKWLPINDVVLQPESEKEWFPSVNSLLLIDNVNIAVLSERLLKTFQDKALSSLTTVSSSYLAHHMLQYNSYMGMSFEQKLQLLHFVTTDLWCDNYGDLEILPLNDDRFTTIGTIEDIPVFFEEKEVVELFPSKSSRFVSSRLPIQTKLLLEDLMKRGYGRLKRLDSLTTSEMIRSIITKNFGTDNVLQIDPSTFVLWKQWFQSIWKFIQSMDKNAFDDFKDLPLFPLYMEGDPGPVEIYMLSDHMIHVTSPANHDARICEAFRLLSVPVVSCIPDYLRVDIVEKYLHEESMYDMNRLFENIKQRQIDNYNDNVDKVQQTALVEYVSNILHGELSSVCISNLKKLKLFQQYESVFDMNGCLVGINEDSVVFNEDSYPIKFPRPVIRTFSRNELNLTKSLGTAIYGKVEMAISTLHDFNCKKYNANVRQTFMFWLLRDPTCFDNFEIKNSLFSVRIGYIETMDGSLKLPSELFDPSDTLLERMFKLEDRFPVGEWKSDVTVLQNLRTLGLLTRAGVEMTHLEDSCNMIHKSAEEQVNEEMFDKAEALLELVNLKPHLYGRFMDNKRIVPVKPVDNDTFPECLELKNGEFRSLQCISDVTSSEHIFVTGTTRYMMNCAFIPHLAGDFGWNKPPFESVVEHFGNIVSIYADRYKPQFVVLITKIYEWLSEESAKHEGTVVKYVQTHFNGKPFVWNGAAFAKSTEVYTRYSDSDIALSPFVSRLPKELEHLKYFFEVIGCTKYQNADMYYATLMQIKSASENSEFINESLLLRVTIDILKKIVHDYDPSEEFEYIPVLKASKLSFERISNCVYREANDPLIISGCNDIYQVHSALPSETAKALGVRSFRQRTLSETYSFEEWGQEEPLTTKIRTLIKHGYTDGFSVIKEMFQNAEDAKASTFFILFDYRENLDARSSLLCDKLDAFQGPALWIYNDATFSESDFQNIRRLGERTKENDAESIGKFGLGFCSVYNITDLPSLLSGSSMIIFDPHSTNLQNDSPGLRIDFNNGRNKQVKERYIDQFKPFENVFRCNISSQNQPYFNGTLFRLPFRTQSSTLSDTVYSKDRIETFLDTIAGNLSNLLLFNENVTHICVYTLPNDCSNPLNARLKLEVNKQCSRLNANYDNEVSVMKEITNRKKESETTDVLTFLEKVTIKSTTEGSHEESVWLVATASCTKTECTVNELPIASVAIPVCTSLNTGDAPVYNAIPMKPHGRYFCTLPLGEQFHHFAFHINGHFKVSLDRLHIIKCKSDERLDNTDANWNNILIGDCVVTALVNLLSVTNIDNAYDIWPDSREDDFENSFVTSFYDRISGECCCDYRVFKNNETRLNFSKSRFLCPRALEKMEDHHISVSTITVLANDPSLIVNIPPYIFEHLKQSAEESMKSRVISAESFILNYFLPKSKMFLDVISEKDRNNILNFAIALRNEDIKRILQTTPCIPSDNGSLKLLSDMIDEESEVSKLFPSRMGFFPQHEFVDESIKDELLKLGLRSDILSDAMVIERVRSILPTYLECAECAKVLCRRLFKYLSTHIAREHMAIVNTLATIPFLPVMRKPQTWPFKWYADSFTKNLPIVNLCNDHLKSNAVSVLWRQPCNLFAPTCRNLLGCNQFIVDTDLLNSVKKTLQVVDSDFYDIFEVVGIRQTLAQLTVSSLVDNLLIASDSVYTADTTMEYIALIFRDIYDCIERKDNLTEVQSLKDKKIVWILDRLVSPRYVSRNDFDQRRLCYPFLFCLVDSPMKRCPLLCDALQIRDTFSAKYIAAVVQELKIKYSDYVMNEETTSSVIALLKLLKSCFEKENITQLDNFLRENNLSAINAPDENMKMRSCPEMCFDDAAIEKTDTMMYVHRDVPHEIAIKFGVVSKYLHQLNECSEDIVDFYQNEPLVTRLRRLIDGYPCDSGLFKELLQNADDAGASEVIFMLDFDTHSVDKIFNEESEPLQGPALCVFNDCPFSMEDLEGIQHLGHGGKFGTVGTIGRYGVGFNSVYNLTDIPSLLTKGKDTEYGETLCIFDPLAKHLPGINADKPGKRFKRMSYIRENCADLLLGYHEQRFFKHSEGTVFRFPLRQDVSDIKPHSIVKIDELEQLLNCFAKELSHTVIFLRNIENVRILHHRDGNYIDQCNLRINVTGSNVEERKSLCKAHAQLCAAFSNDRDSIFKFDQTSFQYEIETEMADYSGIQTIQSFQVIQTLGFGREDDVPSFVRHNYVKENNGRLPQGGVVRPTHTGGLKGKAYCFLPLPIETGLPFHVNGHFALNHETRRIIWKAENTDECFKTQWNIALLHHVISKAYILLLQSLIQQCSNHYPENVRELYDILSCFPIYTKADGFYWKELTASIYKRLFHDDLRFLPCQNINLYKNKISNVNITWERPTTNCIHCPVYILHEQGKSLLQTQSFEIMKQTPLSTFLKYLGIKVIDVPDVILESIESSKCMLTKLSPKYVIEFLCSHDDPSCDCCELEMGQVVEKTKFKTCEHVKEVMSFCAQDVESLFQNLDSVPLFLTADKVLRTLSRAQTVFVTNFTDLFPSNQLHNFLHKCLLQCICSMEYESPNYEVLSQGLLKHLTISEFLSFATKKQTYLAISDETYLPLGEYDHSYVPRFWSFFTDEICYQIKQMDVESTDKAQLKQLTSEGLMEMASLCVIPATCREGNDQILVSFKEIDMLIEIDSFAEGTDLHQAISKFDIHHLNKPLLQDVSSSMLYASDILLEHIPRLDTPAKILKCFIKNIEKIKTSNLDSVLAKAVLKYFNDHVSLLKDHNDVQMMRRFPFFETRNNHLIIIEGSNDVFVLSDEIPATGLDLISRDDNIIFLKDIQVKHLYQRIGIPTVTVEDTYVNLIFPRHEQMTIDDFCCHIEFVCRYLFSKQSRCSSLLDALKNIAFIDVGNEAPRKRIQDTFYDDPEKFNNENGPFFSRMCQRHEMLPEMYNRKHVVDIFKQIGLQWKMTTQLFVRFANEIEHDSSQSNRGRIERSKLLVDRLLNKKSSLEDIDLFTIQTIKFIFPKRIKSKLINIHDQFSINNPVSFSESVSPTKKNIHSCWTTLPILPDYVTPRPGLMSQLGVIQKPSLIDVFDHCINIGRSLERRLPQLLTSNYCELLKMIMENIYETLESYDFSQSSIPSELRRLPFIYFPEYGLTRRAANVVVRCNSDDEISPYLIKAPSYFGRFEELFIKLGASETVTIKHYVDILAEMFQDFGSCTLAEEAKLNALQAMMNVFVRVKREYLTDCQFDSPVYLLNEQNCLRNGKDLVICDNVYLRERVQRGTCLDFMIDCGQFPRDEIKMNGILDVVKAFPTSSKPQILSEIVKEEVDLSNLGTEIQQTEANNLQCCLHDDNYIVSFCRLTRHAMRKANLEWNDTVEEKIKSCIKNMTCKQAVGIKTRLVRNETNRSEPIENTLEPKLVHIYTENSTTVVLFETNDSDDWQKEVNESITIHLNSLVNNCLQNEQLFLAFKLLCCERPSDCSSKLDRKYIEAYGDTPMNSCVIRHDYSEATRWQRQARSDLESARVSLDVYSRISSNWVCYQAHQAAEKSLKAAWFANDANKAAHIQCTHFLTLLAQDLNANLVTLTQRLNDFTREHTRMRYPDTMSAPQIPAEYYSHEDATTCVQIATEILDKVEEDFLTHE